MEDRSLAIIEEIDRKKSPHAQLIVCGCLPKINEAGLREAFTGTIVKAENEAAVFEDLCGGAIKFSDVQANQLHPFYHSSELSLSRLKPLIQRISSPRELRCGALWFLAKLFKSHKSKKLDIVDSHTFYIKTSSGCANECSYCGVKLSRGNIQSKPIPHIIDEIRRGLDDGYKKFGLIGTDLGSYGMDLGCDLVDLFHAVHTLPNGFEVKLRNVNPGFIVRNLPRFLEALDYGFTSWICSAIQAGNNRILSLMKRGYRIEDCIAAFTTIRKKFPDLRLKTQLMVGFPTETEEEFSDTLKLLDQIEFDSVENYMFQPRPGTRAAEMEGQIPRAIALDRCYRLHKKSLFH
jgi:MiaB/RimO family radical SAM methylthiotransferase